MGRASGISEEKLRDITRWRDSDVYDDDERLVLELADAVSATPAVVTADLRHRLVDRFGERAVVELVANLAWENYRARFNRAFDVQAQGFSEGAYCVLPDAHSSSP